MTDETGSRASEIGIPKPVDKLISNAPAMLAFSNLARAGSFLLPVPSLYLISTPAAAFWLLATTLVSLQNLLFLGVPQILVRMLAVANSGAERSVGDVSLGDLAKLMRLVFTAASIVITLLMLTAGSLAIAKLAGQTEEPFAAWSAWLILVLGTPIRIVILCRLTFLNGIGEVAKPRLEDAIAWTVSGILATIVLAVTQSLMLMALATLLPIVVLATLLRRMAGQSGWETALSAPASLPLRKVAKQVWAPCWRAGLGALLSTGSRQGGGVALAQLASPTLAAGYLLAQNIISVIMMLSAAPMQSVLHQMAVHFARAESARHVLLAEKARARSLWIAGVLAGLVAVALPLLNVFNVGEGLPRSEIWAMLALGLFLQRYGAAHLQHYTITNHVLWHWLDGVSGVINILLCIALIPNFGGEGAAAAYLISIISFYAWMPSVLVAKRFGVYWKKSELKSSLMPFILLIATLTGVSFIQF